MEAGIRDWAKIKLMIAVLVANYPILGKSLRPHMTHLNVNYEGLMCIEYKTINQLKNLVKIIMHDRAMSYFPDKNCSNPAPEEDNRPLDLPNLETIFLKTTPLLKFPDISLMPKLASITVSYTSIAEIPGAVLQDKTHLKTLTLFSNKLSQPPNITGSCDKLTELAMSLNKLTSFPDDYFKGCQIQSLHLSDNNFTKFPNFLPLGDSVESIQLHHNQISGIITNEMVKDLRSLTDLRLKINNLQGFDASFCHVSKPAKITVMANRNLTMFENPYRLCPSLLDTFETKPKIVLYTTNIPCDHHRC